jgi:hypothetical protein
MVPLLAALSAWTTLAERLSTRSPSRTRTLIFGPASVRIDRRSATSAAFSSRPDDVVLQDAA